jgi:ribonuclease R
MSKKTKMQEKRDLYQKALLDYLKLNQKYIFKSRRLAGILGIPASDYQFFKKIIKELEASGKIKRFKGGKYGWSNVLNEAEGILHVKTQGYGFVLRDDGGEDVFISERNMGTAIHNDKVKVRIWAQPVGRRPEGSVSEILERGYKLLVGNFQEGKSGHFVIPDDLKIGRDIYIREQDRGGAENGQKVAVQITEWIDGRRNPEGRITAVLGFPGHADADAQSVIHAHNLPLEFPLTVLDEAAALAEKPGRDEMEKRLDLRDLLVFTIDPDDAKDFDDAVSLEYLENGNFRLGVHIADVSALLPSGGAMDKEAFKRGNSTYLVDRVIPMLPERLSNQLCSLMPNVDRLTFSVFIILSPEADILDYEITETVINSNYRLTYRQVKDILDDEKTDLNDTQLFQVIHDMSILSRKLFKKWRAAGSIDFDTPEPKIDLDDKGNPVRLGIYPRWESHKLIESFMLLANKIVAEHIHKIRSQSGKKISFLYRVHEKPSGEKLEKFLNFIHALGYSFKPGRHLSPTQFQRFLDGIKGTRHEIIVGMVALRSMMKAVYTTKNVGHFGLAFHHYTHFTSPIRRYPDLIVHRLLKAQLAGKNAPGLPVKLEEIGRHCTECEIRSQKAEWDMIEAKQAVYMERHVGDEFNGIICGVTGFGFFVEIPDFLVEGLVHVKDLLDDYYVFDEKRYSLTGERSGRTFRLGAEVRIRVSRVDISRRKIDFELVEMPAKNAKNTEK